MDSAELPKPYELTFEPREGYLYAYVAGEQDTFEICFAYWSEIGRKLAELKLDRVLVVEDIAEESPMVDVYELASKLPDIGFRGISIAFVDRYASHQDLNDFGVLVASNRGLIGRAFHNEAEAVAWLTAK